jgi:phosphoglycolate phosphatase-like HAD superfamily hydrolase
MPLMLFDIDATLISTSGAGIRAMEAAGRELFGPTFSSTGVEYAGRLDPLIVRDLLTANGEQATPANTALLRSAYGRHLHEQLRHAASARSLPGVSRLLDLLEPRATLGLLTGNYADTGSIKLRACGIDPARFPIAAWGDESPHDPPDRSHLPPVALARYRARFGRNADPARCAIIGDTPHDVRCAKVNGLRALGVATGMFSADALRRAGADLVLPDLSDAGAAADWLLSI